MVSSGGAVVVDEGEGGGEGGRAVLRLFEDGRDDAAAVSGACVLSSGAVLVWGVHAWFCKVRFGVWARGSLAQVSPLSLHFILHAQSRTLPHPHAHARR